MNILFLTKEIPYPANNGHRMRTSNLLQGLERKNRVHLVCQQKADMAQAKWRVYWQAAIGLFSTLPFSIKRRYSPRMKKEINRILEEKTIDLIFCDSLYQAPYVSLNGNMKVLCEHNIESMIIYRYLKLEKNIFKKIYAWTEFLKMRGYEHKMWKSFDRCFVVSEKDRAMMGSRINKENIGVIPNGVDTKYFSPQNTESKPFSLIYTGQLNWHPNEDAVIYFLENIYPLIKKQIPQTSFYLVGKGASPRIKRYAERDAAITITGYVEDIRCLIAQANIFVVPLRIGSGTRLKILEALAMGKAIVSTSVGCEGIEVTDGKNIVIADKPALFASRVIEMFNHPSLVKKIGAAGRALAEEKYSWQKITEGLSAIVSQGLDISVGAPFMAPNDNWLDKSSPC